MLMIKGLVHWFFELAFFAPMVVWIFVEEKILSQSLPGYAGYLEKVRSRLIPGIW
jgi:hypothetical protein